MARRRPPRGFFSSKKSGKQHLRQPRRPKACRIEALEERLQFVVLHGGDVFEFSTNGGQTSTGWVRVVVTGNTTVELVGAQVNSQGGFIAALNGMDGAVILGPDAGIVGRGFLAQLPTPPQIFESIYAIDVVQSDATSGIAIAAVPAPAPGLTLKQRPMQPFNGNNTLEVAQTLVSGGTGNNIAVVGPPSNGDVLLGALTVNTMNPMANNIPILSATAAPGQFTFVPAGTVTPGLTINSPAFNSFQFGGTITGNVTIHGSINTFYGGWIVTGNSAGETDTGIVSVPHNFNVDGDIRSLLSAGTFGSGTGPVGGKPMYSSGFDLNVVGRVGQINTQQSLLGDLTVDNSNPALGFATGTPVNEVEFRGTPTTVFPPLATDPWDQGVLGGATFLNNDTFDTAQYLGADANGNVSVAGELDSTPAAADYVDYYAVPLLAGQTVTVQVVEGNVTTTLIGAAVNILDAGVFDPDGRLIATDFSRVDPTQTQEQPFQFTADRPGVYRFAVAASTNANFDAAGGTPLTQGTFPYTLNIKSLGNLALGGVVAASDISDNPNGAATTVATSAINGFHVLNGDFGAAVAGNDVISEFGNTGTGVNTFAVDNGNLRAVVGSEIGLLNGANITLPPSVSAPNGSVGLLRATGALLAWNDFVAAAAELTQAQSTAFSIGGDYQWVDAPTATFFGDLVAKGNIGTIRVGNMATLAPSYLQVNAADNPALHGTIDLIDSQGNIGTLAAGGPGITTGPDGNVRYIHLGVGSTAFRDAFFGSGAPNETVYQPGETATITDDSGTIVSLTPVGGTGATVTTTNGVSQVTYAAPAQLTVLTYPIRGSGGAAIVLVRSTDSLNVAASGAGGTQSAEIGSIELDGPGTAVVNHNTLQTGNGGTAAPPTPPPPGSNFPGAGRPGGPPVKNPNAGLPFILPVVPALPTLTTTIPLTLNITGAVKLDVWDVHGPEAADGSLSGQTAVTTLTNSTGGEIVNLHVSSLGTLTTSGALGLPVEQNTPSAVLGLVHNPLSEDSGRGGEPWTYPFLDPTSMARITGNVVSITAAKLGNVYAGFITSGGATGTGTQAVGTGAITLGQDGNIGSISAPIIGPIVSAGSIGSTNAQSGFAPHGSGAVGGAGLYAVGVLGPVTSNGDMRGEIVSTTATASLAVNNGSIAEAAIGTLAEFDFAEQRAGAVVITSVTTPITRPQLDIGPITVTGNGGIIGTEFLADHEGPITVASSGFGMFDSLIALNGDGTLAGISVGGYGIRDGLFSGGARFGPIVANGNGSNLPVTNFSANVRQSETGAQFTSSGTPISFLNDIDSFLGTSAATPSIVGVTDSGVIEDATVEGSRDLASVTAYSIRGRDLSTLTSVVTGFTAAITPAVTNINVANSIGTITVTGPVNGLSITTGRSSKYQFGGDVSNFSLTIAGPIANLMFKSSLGGTSSINAIGPSGRIGTLTIDGNLAGTVHAQTTIQTLHVLGTITGTVDAARIGTIHVSGTVGSGGLTINGPLTNLMVDGGFGPAGNPIQVNGNANTIRIKGDLAANLNVTGKLAQLIIGGSIISGSMTKIGGVLNLLQVAGDIQAGAVVEAQLIKRQKVKGQIQGTILTP